MSDPDHETIIVEDDDNGGLGLLVSIVLIVALLAIGYLIFFKSDTTSRAVNVDVPAVNVNVVSDGQ